MATPPCSIGTTSSPVPCTTSVRTASVARTADLGPTPAATAARSCRMDLVRSVHAGRRHAVAVLDAAGAERAHLFGLRPEPLHLTTADLTALQACPDEALTPTCDFD